MSYLARERYEPSGGVSWANFLPLAGVFLLCCVAIGWVLTGAFRAGIYFLIIMPLMAGALACAPLYAAIDWGHCRSRTLGIALAVVGSAVLYVSYYHADYTLSVGPAQAFNLPVFLEFVNWRMANDTISSTRSHSESSPGMFNWAIAAFEIAAVGAMLVTAGWHTSRRPYSEAGGDWMGFRSLLLPSGGAELLATAISKGQLAEAMQELQGHTRLGPKGTITFNKDWGSPPNAVLMLYSASNRNAFDADTNVYLTLKEVVPGYNNAPQPRVLVDMARLKPEEVALLEQAFTSEGGTALADGERPAGDDEMRKMMEGIDDVI